ncbi:MAG TPA: RagB/SusD family nutrient uptake outer membrane protein, partial [Bacteroidales bacterium]|nr:RagB/SusD family nutrient uptake outer membrane protein [Bacteroidales bacterium]
MKKLIYIIAASIFLFAGCENFLDTESYTKKNTSNFPATQADAEQMITGIYATMNDLIANPESHPFFIYEMAGDDRFGGGSTSNRGSQSMDRLMNAGVSFLEQLWKVRYSGIFRANNAIETMDNVKGWVSEGKREQLLGEAY